MNGRLLAKQGLAADHWLYINQIEQARKVAMARKESASDVARPKWAITSYLHLAKTRRLNRLRTLLGMTIAQTRLS